MRLRCRAHNQYGAECIFGAEFMRHKRQVARCEAMEARAFVTKAQAQATAAAENANEGDVIPRLRRLGFRMDEARRAAARCESLGEASLEERVCVALSYLSAATCRVSAPTPRTG